MFDEGATAKSTHHTLLFVAVFRSKVPLYPPNGGRRHPWSLRGPHGEPGRVYSARNTQDARNYGLSIISYASRYLLNIVPAYFSGEFACRGKRVSSKGGEGLRRAGAVPFFPCGFRHGSSPVWGCIVRADTETGSRRNSASRKSRPQTFACSEKGAR